MKSITFCTVGNTPALMHARNNLAAWGYRVILKPDPSVTHLLLPVPSLNDNLHIHGGPSLEEVISQIPNDCTILGGMLPQLSCKTVDFLKDEYYTAENAAITAHCALSIVLQKTKHTLINTDVLIIGWGRIGKCLAELFRSIGANPTIAVRKMKDEAILLALGYRSIQIKEICTSGYPLIINTVPAPILELSEKSNNSLILDLASVRGILGENIHWERGLPGKMMPESSGLLMAKTALRYALGKE